MLDTLLSIGGLTHSVVSGISHGRRLDDLLRRYAALDARVERLSSSIYYVPSIMAVQATPSSSSPVLSAAELLHVLEPLQRTLGGVILSTGAIAAPEKTRAAFKADPRTLLIDIRPLTTATPHTDPSMVPIVFQQSGQYYVGWQAQGVLPLILSLDYCLPSPLSVANGSPVSASDTADRLRGTVKWFNSKKGFGFITPDDSYRSAFASNREVVAAGFQNMRDAFVWHEEISGPGRKDLRDGQRVEFSLTAGMKGPAAVRVLPLSASDTDDRLRGTVKWFNSKKGFGFITPDDSYRSAFASNREVVAGGFQNMREVVVRYDYVLGSGLKDLRDGQRVEFSLAVFDTEPTAVRIVPLD